MKTLFFLLSLSCEIYLQLISIYTEYNVEYFFIIGIETHGFKRLGRVVGDKWVITSIFHVGGTFVKGVQRFSFKMFISGPNMI